MLSPLDRRSPVVFFINGIGDTILNLPALRALTKVFAGRMKLLCTADACACILDELRVAQRVPVVSEVTNGGREFDPGEVAAKCGDCDLFVSLVPWQSHSLKRLIDQLAPQATVGYFPGFDVELSLDYQKHTSELAFDAVRHFRPDLDLRAFVEPIQYPAAAVDEAREILGMLGGDSRTLVVHADTQARKMWPSRHFTAVLDDFLSLYPDYFVLLVGHTPEPIDSGLHRDRIIPCYGLRLVVALSLVAQADLFLGVDSCMLHAADFARTPSVGLFGPTQASEFGILVGPHITLQASEMPRLQPTDVLAALEALVERPSRSETWHLERGRRTVSLGAR